jgi:zinc transporter, ZIP family
VKAAVVALALVAAAVVVMVLRPLHRGHAAGELGVTHAKLRPGQIVLVLVNGSEEPARVAQVILNDAFVDFRATRQALLPGTAERITVSYPWIRGEAYDIELLTSTGATVGYEIEDA